MRYRSRELLQRLDLTQEIGIPGEALQPLGRSVLQQQPWILRPFPEHFIQLSPDRVAGVIPCPMHIERERLEALQWLRQGTGSWLAHADCSGGVADVPAVHRQLRTSGMSSPYLAMYCVCSISLSRIACCT